MTEKWIKDTGLVLSFLLVLLGLNGGRGFLFAALAALLVTALAPRVLYPFAYLWLKLTHVLAFIVPKAFFGLVFFVVVLPVGSVRKLLKGDSMLIVKWKEAKTAFVDRNHQY
ncbi:MAG: SxtJ family membrane protein, partial [Candidatus Paceibacterota bacterium]